jgi:glycosyltransferase involved in cell wall biosynthesis
MHKFRERILYRYGLKQADRVLVQTRKQKEMLRTHFKRDSVIIPMPCPGLSDQDYINSEQERKYSQRVLWIGRICKVKRPDRLLDIAEACPDLNFDLVGPGDDTEYARSIHQRAKAIVNVTLHGPASRDCVSKFYKNSRLMCCTSDFEGFPNTFIEAWSYGLPIISTFDPDNLIINKAMGIVDRDVKGLASGIRILLNNSQQWQQASEAARQYYLENHTIDAVMPRFENVFKEVMNSI